MTQKPAYYAYSVVSHSTASGESQSRWTRIGAAFHNRDSSVTVLLNALPVNARIVLRVPDDSQGESAEPTRCADEILDG